MINKILFLLSGNEKKLKQEIYHITGLRPKNIQLYKQAFRHSSASQFIEGTDVKNSNERLEFLGDAVLNLIVAQSLFLKFPFKDEGFLTQLRSKIVSREQLNSLAVKIGIEEFINFDKKLGHNRHRMKSLPGNTFEAFIGALFLDKGFDKTKFFLCNRVLNTFIDIDELINTESNFKSRIINWCQKEGKKIQFQSAEKQQGNKQKIYVVEVVIDEKAYGVGSDFNKRKAEQEAAEKTCRLLNV